jgi:crossover junction endodeoxyribonuclease RusA
VTAELELTETAPAAVFELELPLFIRPQRPRKGGKATNRSRVPKPVPYSANWANGLHWAKKRLYVNTILEAVTLGAKAAKIPVVDHLTVQLHWAPADNVKADEDNLVPSAKAACDAISRPKGSSWAGLSLVPDDSPEYMTRLHPRIHRGHTVRRLWLTVQIGQHDSSPPCPDCPTR